MTSILSNTLIEELKFHAKVGEKNFLKTRLDVLPKPIVGKLSEKDALQIS